MTSTSSTDAAQRREPRGPSPSRLVRVAGRSRRFLPYPARRALRQVLTGKANPRWGNLRRLTPFSDDDGRDRGTPIERFYVDRFISQHWQDLRGRVLEARYPRYARRHGDGKIESHVLDTDPGNLAADVIADLAEPASLPEGTFDCVVLMQGLQSVRDLDAALTNAWRTLVPGGVLLLSLPAAGRIDPRVGPGSDFWRLTAAGLGELMGRSFPASDIKIVSYGNLLAVVASLLGIAAEELRERELKIIDPNFPLVVCGRVTKMSRYRGVR